MQRAEETYSMKEISVASGINVTTLNSRRKRMGMEAPKDGEGYTLEQAKQLIRRPKRGRPYSQQKANRLRQRLQTDGVTVK